MNKYIYLFFVLTLASCSSKGELKDVVAKYIAEQSKGVIAKPDFKVFEVVDTFTVKDLIDNWYLVNNIDNLPKDTAKAQVGKIASDYEKAALENPEEGAEETNEWRARAVKIKYLEAKDPNETEYYVIKTIVTIPNPAIYNSKMDVFKAYIVSSGMEVLLSIDEDSFKAAVSGDKNTAITNFENLFERKQLMHHYNRK